MARALGELPIVDAHFARGELSYFKVRALTRVATPESEQAFVEIAKYSTASQIARLFRNYERGLEDPQVAREQRRHVHRSETIDGMVRIEIVLPPEEAAIVWDAMEAAMDMARRTTDPAEDASLTVDDDADAIDACVGVGSESPGYEDGYEDGHAPAEASALCSDVNHEPERAPVPTVGQSRADAIVDVARAYLQVRPRTLGSAYELVVVTTENQLNAGPGGIGGFLRDGTPIPLHIARMLAHNGSRVDVVIGEHGELLDVGRRTRAIPAAIARGLWLRDGGCRVPGCGRTRHLHAHHIRGWAQGGPTKLGNLDELEHWLREADVHIDPALTTPKWDGRPMDLRDSLSWMLMGHETRLRGSAAQVS